MRFALFTVFTLSSSLSATRPKQIFPSVQRTLALIKPHAIRDRVASKIISRIKQEGFTITTSKLVHLSPDQAARFYASQTEKPFFERKRN